MRPIDVRKHLLVVFLFAFPDLAGCQAMTGSRPKLPPGLSVEEYALKRAPDVEPLTFVPRQGTQAAILANHQSEREDVFPGNLFF